MQKHMFNLMNRLLNLVEHIANSNLSIEESSILDSLNDLIIEKAQETVTDLENDLLASEEEVHKLTEERQAAENNNAELQEALDRSLDFSIELEAEVNRLKTSPLSSYTHTTDINILEANRELTRLLHLETTKVNELSQALDERNHYIHSLSDENKELNRRLDVELTRELNKNAKLMQIAAAKTSRVMELEAGVRECGNTLQTLAEENQRLQQDNTNQASAPITDTEIDFVLRLLADKILFRR